MIPRKLDSELCTPVGLLLVVLISFALTACDGVKLGDGLPESADCDECHGDPPAAPHPAADNCFPCHAQTVTEDDKIDEQGGLHANGAVDFAISACDACHGNPPGEPHPEETNCFLCHPGAVTEAGELKTGGSHFDGSVDVELGTCDACHGNPPDSPHPDADQCNQCHPDSVGEDGALKEGGLHMNGEVEAAGGHNEGYAAPDQHGAEFNAAGVAACSKCHGEDLSGGSSKLSCDKCHADWQSDCTFCHGDDATGSPAPPPNVAGETDTAAAGVGAHAKHLAGDSTWHGLVITCNDCHPMPAGVLTPGHVNGSVDIEFGEAATQSGAEPTWDGETCTNVYCHGGGLNAADEDALAPAWNVVDGTQAACGTCHGLPPTVQHAPMEKCAMCHSCVSVDAATIRAEGAYLHIDGVLNMQSVGSCPPPE